MENDGTDMIILARQITEAKPNILIKHLLHYL